LCQYRFEGVARHDLQRLIDGFVADLHQSIIGKIALERLGYLLAG
jgi:hypothetical protein